MKPGERVIMRGRPGCVGEILSVGTQPGDLGDVLTEETEVEVYWGTADGRDIVRKHRLLDLDLGPIREVMADGATGEPVFVRRAFQVWMNSLTL